jgi:hypothetical protein
MPITAFVRRYASETCGAFAIMFAILLPSCSPSLCPSSSGAWAWA